MGPKVALRCPHPSHPSSGSIGSKGMATRVEKGRLWGTAFENSRVYDYEIPASTYGDFPLARLHTVFLTPGICLGSVFALSLLPLLLYPCVSSDCPARVFRSSVVHHCFTEDKRANESVGRKRRADKTGPEHRGVVTRRKFPMDMVMKDDIAFVAVVAWMEYQ